MKIRIKYISDAIEKLEYIDGKLTDRFKSSGNSPDEGREFKLIPLGIHGTTRRLRMPM